MNTDILCVLLAKKIPADQWILSGQTVVWRNQEYNTPENNAIVAGVINHYEAGSVSVLADQKRAEDKAQYWQEYLDYLALGFEYSGAVYQCRPDDINDWVMLKNHVELLPGETIIKIRAADNSMNPITVTDFLTLFAPAMGQHVLVARQAYWAKVDAV